MWLEADGGEINKQHFFIPFGDLKNGFRPFCFIPHQVIDSESEVSRKIKGYGYDLKKDGFVRKAEYQKAIFEIFDYDDEIRDLAKRDYQFDNPILREAWNIIRPSTTVAKAKDEAPGDLCDGILFIVSLGGGTGSGFINPITKYIRDERSAYPVFVIGVLTERGDDPQQGTPEEQRDLSAVISMHDLLTEDQGIDGLILIDNQILIDKFGKNNYPAFDKFIFQSMKPLLASRSYPREDPTGQAIRDNFWRDLEPKKPPILVPCFSGVKKWKEEDLIKEALRNGKLLECDPHFADKAFIFARGFLDADRLTNALAELTGLNSEHIKTWRKLGDSGGNEVLVLLRNPYGFKDGAKGDLDRIHGIIEMALQYLRKENEVIPSYMPEDTKIALGTYFYGNGWVDEKINALETAYDSKENVFGENLAFKEKLCKAKIKLSSNQGNPIFFKGELDRAIVRLEEGKKPIFTNELKIFDKEIIEFDQRKQDSEEKVEDRLEKIENILAEMGCLQTFRRS